MEQLPPKKTPQNKNTLKTPNQTKQQQTQKTPFKKTTK